MLAPSNKQQTSMAFSDDELDRYARHIVLRELGGPGQQKLKEAKVLVIGAGGLGAPALLYLAAAGIGEITIVDDDAVSLSNLQRQIIFATDQIGLPKTAAAATRLNGLNPNTRINARGVALSSRNASEIMEDHDLILDGTDTFESRRLINAEAAAQKIPLISAAMAQWEGQITLYDPARGAPCFNCVFPSDPAPGQAPSCAEAGIVGALAGVMGSMMALEAVKEIAGAGESLRGQMLIYDALWGESRKLALSKRPDCEICAL